MYIIGIPAIGGVNRYHNSKPNDEKFDIIDDDFVVAVSAYIFDKLKQIMQDSPTPCRNQPNIHNTSK
jgi:hypothetical protein